MATQSIGYTPSTGIINHDGDGGTVGPMKTANTALDGTGTVNTLLTAGANGSAVMRIRFTSAGANIATVARIFINDGGGATAVHNVFWGEVQLPSTGALTANSPTTPPVEIAGPANLQGTYKLLVVLGTTVSAGWYCSAEYANW